MQAGGELNARVDFFLEHELEKPGNPKAQPNGGNKEKKVGKCDMKAPDRDLVGEDGVSIFEDGSAQCERFHEKEHPEY